MTVSYVHTCRRAPQGPDSVARALAAYVETLNTPSDAAPVVRSLVAADSNARRFPAARIDVARLGEHTRVWQRFNARDSLTEIAVETTLRRGGTIAIRLERYEPYPGAQGWRRFLDDVVYLDASDVTLDSAYQVMDGVTHRVARRGDVYTLAAVRPGTGRGWSEARRLPRALHYASDAVLAAVTAGVGDTVRFTSFGLHGGYQQRLVTRTRVTVAASGADAIHAIALGKSTTHRWLVLDGTEHVATYYGAVPGKGSRTMRVERARIAEVFGPLADSDRSRWVTTTAPGAAGIPRGAHRTPDGEGTRTSTGGR